MNDIKRYEYVGHSCDGIEPDNDGEFVKFDDYEKRVAELEDRVAGQLRALEVAGNYIEKLEDQIKILSELNVKYIEINEGAE